MHSSFVKKLLIGIVTLVIVVGGFFVARSISKSNEKQREILESILRTSDGRDFGSLYQTTPHFDGGEGSTIETYFTKSSVTQVQEILQQRLSEKGYKLTCPGGKDTQPTTAQDLTTEPRQKCGVSGHGAEGTVWLGTAVPTEVPGTWLSAVVSF